MRRADKAQPRQARAHHRSHGRRGRTDYNLELSKRRALSVKTWLVKEGGIANEDVLAVGLGEKKPMASNDTADGRAKNRRVEVMMPTGEAREQPPPNKN